MSFIKIKKLTPKEWRLLELSLANYTPINRSEEVVKGKLEIKLHDANSK